MRRASPLVPFLEGQGFVVLDGGLATELERRGHDLDHPLWSAEVLRREPQAIVDVHRDYLAAGADCIIASSYQASLPGFEAEGLSRDTARRLIASAVRLASDARDVHADRAGSGLRPLVAASIGPYGAFRADGSEYTGDYGVTEATLHDFHASRWEVLVGAGADLLACETIPSLPEAVVLRALLEAAPHPAWISFSCADEERLADGTPLASAVALFADCPSIVALGVNCVPPRAVGRLIGTVRSIVPDLPIVVYPNSGERYKADGRHWVGESDPSDFGALARQWHTAGARIIGGCCRTSPGHVTAIRRALSDLPRPK